MKKLRWLPKKWTTIIPNDWLVLRSRKFSSLDQTFLNCLYMESEFSTICFRSISVLTSIMSPASSSELYQSKLNCSNCPLQDTILMHQLYWAFLAPSKSYLSRAHIDLFFAILELLILKLVWKTFLNCWLPVKFFQKMIQCVSKLQMKLKDIFDNFHLHWFCSTNWWFFS